MYTGDVPYHRERRMLAKLSSGRQMNLMGGGPGGQPEYTAQDIAAGIAQLRRFTETGERVPDLLTQSLLLSLWAGDESRRDPAARELVVHVSRWAAREEWRARPGWLTGMCLIALSEYAHRKPCTTCSATGRVMARGDYQYEPVTAADGSTRPTRVWTAGGYTACEPCRGLGVFPWSLRDRAAAMTELGQQVAHTTWHECWDERYRRIIQDIQRIENRGLRKLRRALRGG